MTKFPLDMSCHQHLHLSKNQNRNEYGRYLITLSVFLSTDDGNEKGLMSFKVPR